MFSEKDHMTTVSENIMLGQLAPLGTGCFSLLLDDEKLEDAIEVQLGAAYDPFLSGSLTPGRMTPGRSPGMTPSRLSPSGVLPAPALRTTLLSRSRVLARVARQIKQTLQRPSSLFVQRSWLCLRPLARIRRCRRTSPGLPAARCSLRDPPVQDSRPLAPVKQSLLFACDDAILMIS